MLVSQTSPLGVELFSYANAFFCSNKFAYMLAAWVKTLYSDLFCWLRLGLVPGSRYVCSPRVPSPPPFIVPFLPDPYSALATQPAHPQVDVQKSPSSDLICATSSLAWLLRCLKSPLRSLRNSWGRLVASLIPRTFRALARGIQMGDFRHVQKFCSAWTKDVFFGKLCIYLQSDILTILYFRRYKALTQFL